MAVKSVRAEAPSEQLRQDIKTAATISNATLNVLRSLLGFDLIHDGAGPQCLANKARPASAVKKAVPNSMKQKPKRPNVRSAPEFSIYESPKTPITPLNEDSKRKLATEVLNNNLKHLNDAVKAAVAGQNKTNLTGGKKPVAQPLQNCSPNRKPPPSTDGKIKNTATALSENKTDLAAIADCGSIALDYLRQHDTDPKTQSNEKNGWPLIRGALFFLDKVVTLKLKDHAIEQIKRIKLDFDKSLKISNAKLDLLEQPSIAKLLCQALSLDIDFRDKPLFGLATSFQSQVLRTALLYGRTVISDELLSALRRTDEHGPHGILLRGLEHGLLSPEQSATQLRILSQALMTLCATNASEDSGIAHMVFKLRSIALEIRCHAWNLVPQQVATQHDLWEHFGRAVSRYRDDCQGSISADYNVVKAALHSLQKTMGITDAQQSPSFSKVRVLLADMAQRAGLPSDSLALLERQSREIEQGNSMALLLCRCKIATLLLSSWKSDREAAIIAAEKVLDLLKRELKGSAAEMDNLLILGVRLRKACLDSITEIEGDITKAAVTQVDIQLQICALRTIYAFLNFVARYLATSACLKTDSTEGRKSVDRFQAQQDVAHKTIEAVLVSVKCANAWMAVLLTETDTALMKCVAMASLWDEKSASSSALSISSPFVRISNSYWSQFVEFRSDTTRSRESRLMLDRSVEILSNRSMYEKEKGFLATKYMALSSSYVERKSLQQAKQALRNAIDLLIEIGALSEAVELSLSGPLEKIWSDQSSKVGLLGKALYSYLALNSNQNLKPSEEPSLYDDINIPTLHRAVLLEKQLLQSSEILKILTMKQVAILCQQVLDIYSPSQFHVCRLRFAHNILMKASITDRFPAKQALAGSIASILGQQADNQPKKPFLKSYEPVLDACVQIHWTLQASEPDHKILNTKLVALGMILTQCSDTASLRRIVEIPPQLCQLLQAVVDYTGMLDLKQLKLKALRVLLQLLQLENSADVTALILCLTSIGALQTQLGNTLEAGRVFATAEKCISNSEVAAPTAMQWELAYSHYLLEISNTTRCAEVLQSAGAKYNLELDQPLLSTRSRSKMDVHLVQAAFVASKLAFAKGDLKRALLWGRQCTITSTAVWKALERLWNDSTDETAAAAQDDSIQNLATELSNLSFSTDRSEIQSASKGSRFWKHVEMHFDALLHASSLSAHSGLYQDAVYYAEQANKVGLSTHSDNLVARAQSILSLLFSRACHFDQATKTFEILNTRLPHILDNLEVFRIQFCQAASYLAMADMDMASRRLKEAENALNRLIQGGVVEGPNEAGEEMSLVNEMASMKIVCSKPSITTRKLQSQAKPTSKRPASRSKTQSLKSSVQLNLNPSNVPYRSLLDGIALLKAKISLQNGDLTNAASQLSVRSQLGALGHNIQHRLMEASVMIAESIEAFSADAVHCVLAETTIGLPSKYTIPGTEQKHKEQKNTHITPAVAARKATPRVPPKKMKDGASKTRAQDLLGSAYTLLLKAAQGSPSETSSEILHQVHKSLSQLILVNSAISTEMPSSPSDFLSRTLLPKDMMREREAWVIMADIESTKPTHGRKWPVTDSDRHEDSMVTVFDTPKPSQSECLSSLPSSWTVLSLSLNEEKSDLIICRRSANVPPFVLRIPLLRGGADELDEEKFSFLDAKDELTEIVKLANLTAHDARSLANPAARKLWWAEREALDKRLEALLQNMESIWLGGFRGIMTHARSNQDLLARFATSLTRSLDKHLPSRQKPGTKGIARVQLHARVIELFTSLGDPDHEDLDDSVNDLLYFVVDILQFSGEHNAYDEIDFDLILIEVLDALRNYHGACSPQAEEQQHTILILDKELHPFPWESLPCLNGQSVSRIPSLAELHNRLMKVKEQNDDSQALTISSLTGSYILNPHSDLVATQEVFESVFQSQLPEFTAIVNRIPTENEFESCLRDDPLVLYFGHGSGAQYIRARRIRMLEKCAVTFLMGCSSSKMTECGVFESYGVPWNYMSAGSAAVVGTLWDVTDKDIDRFAMKAFANWGLLDGDKIEEGVKGKEKAGKGKKKISSRQADAMMMDDRVGEMALDEAVAKARASCTLRYLNGAAPVIYGVPVALSQTA